MRASSPKRQGDRILLSAIILLLMIGILMVYSSSAFWGGEKYDNATLYLRNHFIRVVLGAFLLVLFSRIDYHLFRPLTPVLFLAASGLLVAVLFTPEFHGARRSLEIFGKRFQPSEFMKPVMIFFLAAIFSRDSETEMPDSRSIYIHYGLLIATVALVFIEPDLGSALILFFLGFSIFFLSGVPWGQMARMVGGIAPMVLLGLALFPYQKKRISDYIQSAFQGGRMSHQVEQSIIGLARGGLAGVGYGEGKQKFLFLPEPFSDFILAHAGEELGFLGLAFIMILFCVVLWRGMRIALHAPDRYGFLLAGGITAMILFNALINAGVVVNLLPTTGLPFPFISYGGSNLIVMMMGGGILINISRQVDVTFSEFTRARSRRAYVIPGG
ncbi:MAG TPA: cell division protein FtsW [bacterium]|nr:cell division protein FtsW [bacterium]